MTADLNPVSAVLIGAGARGRGAYGAWGLKHPDQIRFVAVAEPDDAKRTAFSQEHGIGKNAQFVTWDQLFSNRRLADTCLICTQDQMHTGPALKALEQGYHVLLEKPMATTQNECKQLVQAAETAGRQLRICHVARYAGFFQTAKKALEDGLIGDMVHINHSENVAFWHFAHSYVRGNWRKSSESSPVILAKTCHDLDLLYWLAGSPAAHIHSFGELSHFRKENAPSGAPRRCVDGCPAAEKCPWFAPRLYVTGEPLVRITRQAGSPLIRMVGRLALIVPWLFRFLGRFYPPLKTLVDWDLWPATVITENCTLAEKRAAMKTGPYGRCVYYCDNDVPDHQTVNIRFENGLTANMTMQGHSFLDGRWIRIDGTRGSLMGRFTHAGERLVYYDHKTLARQLLWKRGISFEAHGGGDGRLMASFVKSLRAHPEDPSPPDSMTSARGSLESHLMAFAAEQSRLENRVVPMSEMRN